MSRLVVLTRPDGLPVAINPDRIASVEVTDGGDVSIEIFKHSAFWVRGSFDEVIAKLTAVPS